jgi:hypothetical protein
MSIGIGVGDILKICEIAGRVYKNCSCCTTLARDPRADVYTGRDCTGEYKSLTTEARSLSNLLEDISDKFTKIPDNKRKQLEDAYEPCIEVLQELDKLLEHYNSLDTKTKRAWDRLKWDPEKSKTLRDRLTSSVTMLNGFYTSLIHDNQVLILEALERLEHDYKGGHREESIASLERLTSGTADDEDQEDEAAWTQILRDLEDVGVAKQDALGYRDLIVDWLVQAVNEGRLLEQRPEPDSFQSLSTDLEQALPLNNVADLPGTHHLDVPVLYSSYQRSQSTPLWPSMPMRTPPPVPSHERTQSIPSTASMSVPELSGVSSYAASYSSDSDTSSLYAMPKPPPKIAQATIHQIKRVPVPIRDSAPSTTVATTTNPSVITTSSPSPAASQVAIDVSPSTRLSPPSISQVDLATPSLVVRLSSEAASASSSSLALPEPVAPPSPLTSPLSHAQTAPALLQTPPSYYDKDSSVTVDLAWTAQQTIAAWSRRDFLAAGKHLEEQLTAVERGHTVLSTGTQPDRRILRHLIGVCNAFTGNFVKAKSYFESVFNGIYLNRTNLDDGDIAAARWLGDVCLHLREHSNTALAWGVAHEGSIARYGFVRDRTRRIADELRVLDHWLFVFRRIENSFHSNLDPTDIFRQTHSVEKSNLIASLKTRLYERNGLPGARVAPPASPYFAPSHMIGARPKLEIGISEGFLLGPLISLSAWPLPWDSTFSPMDAVQLDRNMNTIRTTNMINPLADRSLTSLTLGDSKKLHYVTKRGNQWLIAAVKQALQDMGIEHTESPSRDSIICTINQHRDGFAFSEGVEISFKKLQFRSIYGLRVSEAKWSTRNLGPTQTKDTTDFRDILKGILETAEKEYEEGIQLIVNGVTLPPLPSQVPFQSYR